MKPTGTGSSRGPRTRGFGAQMFNSDECVRVEHFFGVPAESIFGGVKVRPRLFRSHTRTHATPARRVRRVQASLTGVRPPDMGILFPLLPFGKALSSIMEVLFTPFLRVSPRNRSPLKGKPTISGDTFGTRARGRPRTAPPRRRHVMPLAMRPLREESGALPAHVSSALGTHTVAAALKRAPPCERLVSGSTPKEITSCQATSRSEFSLFRL